ncbi:hypothetical protein [Massilia yuzhufengensis]|uniref:Dolichyl-phosphate-mannose-protein mannosyltransferase n=1 Tax=Massilia yuzhufengensis TaxID=1164594 RepID=A0A1I1QYD1_9BURK|nr:hypothetical protein [Massilia yuzhufengensis]SFD27141.1 hypothetical protein SAMN05216204_12092 [Massilia yuzhufengensis]
MQRFLPAAPVSRLALFIGFLFLAALLLARPSKSGDFQEYALMTIALASHGTPEIRVSDLDTAAKLSPEPGFVLVHEALRAGMRKGDLHPFPGFVRGKDGGYYAIHFFAYPALAAIPFKLIDRVGGKPLKGFQLVNLGALAILAVALFQFTGSPGRAIFGVTMFLLSGGVLYSNWCSPEFFTASALLGGLVFTLNGRPYLAALLAGVAAMQNPPLALFAAFGPLIRVCYVYAHERLPARAALRKVLTGHTVLASLLMGLLAAAPVWFNYQVFGVPSMIATLATDPALITPARLVSYFFDLNQGAIVGFPVAMALVLSQLLAQDRLRWLPHTIAGILFAVAMAIPSLSTVNWNSGAAGMMRYAAWGGMPLLYLGLTYLQRAPRWPLAVLAALLLVQLGAVRLARSYTSVEFSPAAKLMLDAAPGWYYPEPEIFLERSMHQDGAMGVARVAVYLAAGTPVKILLKADSELAHASLCGPAGRVALDRAEGNYPGGWRYLDGPPRCTQGAPARGIGK